jgi:hypothetical protein
MATLGFLAAGGIQGGVAMLLDPLTPLGMSTEYLAGTPIDTYLLAGWFLLGMAGASLLTMTGLLVRWTWRWAGPIEQKIGFRWPWLGAIATGVVLLAFEIIELFMVPFHPVMHPLLIAVAVALIVLPLTPSARRQLAV